VLILSSLHVRNLAFTLFSGNNPPNDPRGDCFEGYQGILCSDCEKGFTKSGTKCKKCPSSFANVVRLLLFAFVVVIIAIIFVGATLRGAQDSRNYQPVYFKIIVSHIQLLFLSISFDMKWPSAI